MRKDVIGRATKWLRPHVLEASDGILTTAGICEGLAGAGVGSNILIFAGVAGLLAGALAIGGHEYSVLAAERDRQVAQLARERHQLETAPDTELDELTKLYVSRGLSRGVARQVAIELTAHDALKAHAEVEHGIITPASADDPLRGATAAAAAFAAGAALPVLAMVLLPGPSRAPVTFVIVLLALALTGWLAARMSDVRPARLILRTASIGVVAMIITYLSGRLLVQPEAVDFVGGLDQQRRQLASLGAAEGVPPCALKGNAGPFDDAVAVDASVCELGAVCRERHVIAPGDAAVGSLDDVIGRVRFAGGLPFVDDPASGQGNGDGWMGGGHGMNLSGDVATAAGSVHV